MEGVSTDVLSYQYYPVEMNLFYKKIYGTTRTTKMDGPQWGQFKDGICRIFSQNRHTVHSISPYFHKMRIKIILWVMLLRAPNMQTIQGIMNNTLTACYYPRKVLINVINNHKNVLNEHKKENWRLDADAMVEDFYM